jgi:hypothetical protein
MNEYQIIFSIFLILIILSIYYYFKNKLLECSKCDKNKAINLRNRFLKKSKVGELIKKDNYKKDDNKNKIYLKIKNKVNKFINDLKNKKIKIKTKDEYESIVHNIKYKIYHDDNDIEIYDLTTNSNNKHWTQFKISENNKIELIKKLIIEHKMKQNLNPFDIFNSDYSHCVINKSVNLINKSYKNISKKILKKLWTIYLDSNIPIIKINNYDKIIKVYPNLLSETNLKNTNKDDLYKLFINDMYFNKVDFLSKIIYKQDVEILSELLTDIYYQKINISLDELNFNFDIVKNFENSYFDLNKAFYDMYDYKRNIIDFMKTFMNEDKINNNKIFNLFYNFFIINILKYYSRLHFFKYLNLDEDLKRLNKELIKIEKDCFIKNKNNIPFIEISTKDIKGDIYCRYHNDDFCIKN